MTPHTAAFLSEIGSFPDEDRTFPLLYPGGHLRCFPLATADTDTEHSCLAHYTPPDSLSSLSISQNQFLARGQMRGIFNIWQTPAAVTPNFRTPMLSWFRSVMRTFAGPNSVASASAMAGFKPISPTERAPVFRTYATISSAHFSGSSSLQ